MTVIGPGVPEPHPTISQAQASSQSRTTWLVLALDGPAVELGAHAPSARVRVISDPRQFHHLLIGERPRIVVCAQPPADRAVIEIVAAERRRRTTLRAMLLAPPAAVADRLAALDLGFDDALTTTTSAVELAWRLGRLDVHGGRPGAAAVLPVGDDLELDVARHELRRDGRPVHLRPKEFGLLAMLASHPGRSYSRRELLARVWGPAHEGGARTVDVHVRWLRSKLEPDPARPIYLVTVRGVGYRLDGSQR